MPIANNSATIGTTEHFLASNSTTQTAQTEDVLLQAWIDFGNMVAGDQYQVTVYEKINAGTQRTIYRAFLDGVSTPVVTPMLALAEGWEVGVKKLAGTDRSIGWSLRKIAFT